VATKMKRNVFIKKEKITMRTFIKKLKGLKTRALAFIPAIMLMAFPMPAFAVTSIEPKTALDDAAGVIKGYIAPIVAICAAILIVCIIIAIVWEGATNNQEKLKELASWKGRAVKALISLVCFLFLCGLFLGLTGNLFGSENVTDVVGDIDLT
jgi:p-aminobenzoyl-glutamate transporter AbgT